jgi:phosphoglycerate dehydrogenase-like enzyme
MGNKRHTIYIPIFRAPIEPQRKILDSVAEIITGEAKSEAELISILKRVDVVLLTSRTKMMRTVIEACRNLRLIAKYGVGVENIDIDAATQMGIPVMNVPGVNSNAVAEFTIGLMLAALRGIQGAKELIRSGKWQDERFLGRELIDSSIGIIGYGNIAKRVIIKLQSFEVRKIFVFTESKSRETPEFSKVSFVDLQTLLKGSDIVSIHKTLTPSSKHLIGANELQLMQRSAYLINTSRGGLIEEGALVKALQQRWITGAALDVYEQEPLPSTSPLLSMDNVVLTPHIGGATVETREEMVTTVAKNTLDFLSGKEIDPKYIINPEVIGKTEIQLTRPR